MNSRPARAAAGKGQRRQYPATREAGPGPAEQHPCPETRRRGEPGSGCGIRASRTVVDEQVSRSIQQIVKIEESFFALAVLPFRQEPLEQPLDQVVQTHLQRPGVFQFLETLSPARNSRTRSRDAIPRPSWISCRSFRPVQVRRRIRVPQPFDGLGQPGCEFVPGFRIRSVSWSPSARRVSSICNIASVEGGGSRFNRLTSCWCFRSVAASWPTASNEIRDRSARSRGGSRPSIALFNQGSQTSRKKRSLCDSSRVVKWDPSLPQTDAPSKAR